MMTSGKQSGDAPSVLWISAEIHTLWGNHTLYQEASGTFKGSNAVFVMAGTYLSGIHINQNNTPSQKYI